MHTASIVRLIQRLFEWPLGRMRRKSPYTSEDNTRVLSPFLLSKRVFEHVFHSPHPHIRQKQDRTGLWTVPSVRARRVILISDEARNTWELQYELTSISNTSPQPELCWLPFRRPTTNMRQSDRRSRPSLWSVFGRSAYTSRDIERVLRLLLLSKHVFWASLPRAPPPYSWETGPSGPLDYLIFGSSPSYSVFRHTQRDLSALKWAPSDCQQHPTARAMLISLLTPRDAQVTKWPTLWAVAMTHIWVVFWYQQGCQTCVKPTSADETRFGTRCVCAIPWYRPVMLFLWSVCPNPGTLAKPDCFALTVSRDLLPGIFSPHMVLEDTCGAVRSCEMFYWERGMVVCHVAMSWHCAACSIAAEWLESICTKDGTAPQWSQALGFRKSGSCCRRLSAVQ